MKNDDTEKTKNTNDYDIYFHPDVILVQRYFKYIP